MKLCITNKHMASLSTTAHIATPLFYLVYIYTKRLVLLISIKLLPRISAYLSRLNLQFLFLVIYLFFVCDPETGLYCKALRLWPGEGWSRRWPISRFYAYNGHVWVRYAWIHHDWYVIKRVHFCTRINMLDIFNQIQDQACSKIRTTLFMHINKSN